MHVVVTGDCDAAESGIIDNWQYEYAGHQSEAAETLFSRLISPPIARAVIWLVVGEEGSISMCAMYSPSHPLPNDQPGDWKEGIKGLARCVRNAVLAAEGIYGE
jgi:hypothetical protein